MNTPEARAYAEPIEIRPVRRSELSVFSQYLLPYVSRMIAQGDEGISVLGAVCRNLACGAAALRLPGDGGESAELLSLYIDPLARARGVGSGLLKRSAETAAEAGAAWLHASYAAEAEDTEALCRMFRRLGAEPFPQYSTYSMESGLFHNEGFWKNAFSSDYRPQEQIVPFSTLTQEQLEALEAEPELPPFLTPGNRPDMDPSLSLAWVTPEGRVAGFSLACESSPGHYANLAAWHSADAPEGCFPSLLTAQLNLCFYHGGGDFQYHVCSTSPGIDALVERYTAGHYTKKQLYAVHLSLG